MPGSTYAGDMHVLKRCSFIRQASHIAISLGCGLYCACTLRQRSTQLSEKRSPPMIHKRRFLQARQHGAFNYALWWVQTKVTNSFILCQEGAVYLWMVCMPLLRSSVQKASFRETRRLWSQHASMKMEHGFASDIFTQVEQTTASAMQPVCQGHE